MIAALVLAAGRSSRMGAQKLLLPLGGSTAIERVVDRIHGTSVGRIVVVVGRDAKRVREVLERRDVAFVENPDPEGDMLSSVRCGMRALPERVEAFLVALGDQPRLPTAVVEGMVRAFRAEAAASADAGRRGIVVPVCRGRRGHPILLAARHRDEVLERHDGEGLRGLLRDHPLDILQVETDDEAILYDMDDPEAYRREREAIEDDRAVP